MAVVISVKSDMAAVMSRVARQYPRAIEIASQRAVIHTARAVKKAEVEVMPSAFSNPTRFTLNALTIRVDKKNTAATVEVKDGYWSRADNYLQAQIEGTAARKQKAFERALASVGVLPSGWVAVPGQGAKLDSAGNQAVGELRQILSWFNAAERVAGSTQNMTAATRAKRRKGTRTKRGFEYFAVVPGRTTRNGARQRLHAGIYRRTYFGFGASITPVLIFVRSASYKPRFDFYGIADRVIKAEFKPMLNAYLQAEVAKAQASQSRTEP